MKGKLCFVAAALVACILTAPFAAPRAAAENSVLPDFSDNFDSYEADGKFIEENEEFAKNWTKNVLAGGEEQGIDAHLKGIGKIEYENGESGNKVLHLDNASVGMDSYFHIGPAGDYRTKNFTAGFRLKFMTKNAGERGWAGISFRKKATAHYVGTNNLLFTVQRYTKNTEITPHTYAVFNGGATNDFGDASMQSMFGDALRFEDASYKVPSSASGEDMPWVDYKLEVNGNTYKMYLDDFLVADCTFDVKTFDYFGFLSLNCCTADILVDDFYVNIADTELPPVIEKLPSPVVALGEDGKSIKWDRIAGANLYTVYIDGEVVKTSNKTKYEFENTLSAGEHKVQVKAVSEDTFEALDSDLSAEVVYTVAASSSESTDNGEKGCGSTAAFGSLALAGIIAAAVSKRKR